MENSLVISDTPVGEVTVLSISGRLDATHSPDAEKALVSLMDAGRRRFVLDARGLEYISSAGLRVLIAARKRLSPDGGDIRLAGLRPQVRTVFQIAGFDRIFAIYEDTSAAVNSFT
jgi:anti-sigma B factor antagonist